MVYTRRRYRRKAYGKRGYRNTGRMVRLPQPQQPTWKKLAGIASGVADKMAMLPGTMGLAGRAIAGIRNLINVEAKYHDVDASQANQTSTGTITPLTLIAQGDTDQTRNGNSILSKCIDLHFRALINVNAVRSAVKWALVLDKENREGTAPTATQIFSADNDVAFVNMDRSDEFVILKTGDMDLAYGGRAVISFDVHQDLSDLHIKYDGANATQANATVNHLYLYMVSSEATNGPAITVFVRYKFYDN